ncbi:uncharacterized protein LOC123598843 isoform X1 [Leopardus geoffroyi]|uniref:uncharacterized protein LOC123598843 isoform X1 n=1 Tax=Leopardus geoffroyi TaxID=46844 RepID=UPI001E25ED8B|nr:uncharacterized protein LOC123598843 isoform X1 [Leopardus geoffroyi]
MEGKRLPEGHMRQKPMPGRPKMQNPPRRGPLADPETGVTSVSYSSSDCTKKADKDKGGSHWKVRCCEGPPLMQTCQSGANTATCMLLPPHGHIFLLQPENS